MLWNELINKPKTEFSNIILDAANVLNPPKEKREKNFIESYPQSLKI